MDAFSNELGYPAEAQRLTGHRWRLTVASPRVTVTLVYKPTQRGRAALVGSTLAIDGQRVPLADPVDVPAVPAMGLYWLWWWSPCTPMPGAEGWSTA